MINENDKKKYYAINLTEGRIWIIFILLLVLLTVIFFVAVIIIKNNINNNNTLSYGGSSSSTAYFDYHGELGIEDQIINPENKSNDSNSVLTNPEETKVQLIEKTEEEKAVEETKKPEEKISILDD